MGSVIKVLLLIVFAAVVVAAAAVTKVARLQRRLAATPRVVYQTVLTECVDDEIPAARRAGGIPMDGMDRIPSVE
jgi:predicted Holliday junction resolvase-like endonuclease